MGSRQVLEGRNFLLKNCWSGKELCKMFIEGNFIRRKGVNFTKICGEGNKDFFYKKWVRLEVF